MGMPNLFAKMWVRIAIGWVSNMIAKILAINWFDDKIRIP